MRHLFVIALLLFTNTGHAVEWQDSPDVAKLFNQAGIRGTFVLYDADEDRFIGHDQARAETRYVPASTFKIANSLIGLAAGAVNNVDEALPYGGKPQPFKTWERDMSLREAIKISNVPIYQALARRIGLEWMQDGIDEIDYGNGEIGSIVDRFWLDGPLRISAVEQTQFLARLARSELPFDESVQAQVRDIVKLEQGNGWILYGKTGWASRQKPDIGWWVGWVEKSGKVYSFALNIDMPQESDAPKRIELGKASLKALGIF